MEARYNSSNFNNSNNTIEEEGRYLKEITATTVSSRMGRLSFH